MLSDLEDRLATVLGADLPAPLGGRVGVRPDTMPGNTPSAQIAVRKVTPLKADFGSVRLEVVPGDAAPRRVLRLQAEIDIRLTARGTSARDNRRQALDDLIYLLDAPEVRSGGALRDTGDPGFLLESLKITSANYEPELDEPAPADVTLSAVGWFWPVGVTGQDGPAIAEARIAQLVLPVSNDPDPLRFAPGGDDTDIELSFTAAQLLNLRDTGPVPATEPRLAFQLLSADGSAGSGSLINGQNLGGGVRARTMTGQTVSIRYRPPASPARDRLTVRRVENDSEDRFGPTLIELDLITEAAP